MAGELDDGDVADGGRGEEDLSGARVVRFGHFAADEGFLQGEFDVAFEGYGGGHGDHGAWWEGLVCGRCGGREGEERTGLRGEGTADGELHGENGVGVAVRDAVAPAVEGAYVVGLRAACAGELGLAGGLLDLLGLDLGCFFLRWLLRWLWL